MPIIDKKTLFALPVETVSGTALGKVHDIEIDVDQHTIRAYCVRKQFLANPLKGDTHTLRISPSQVQEITKEKMVVDDSTVPAGEEEIAPANPSPAA